MGFFAQLARNFPASGTSLNSDFRLAAQEASNACGQYLIFLKEKLTQRTRGSYALGAEEFDSLLKYSHGLQVTGKDISRIGDKVIEDTIAQMDELAGQIKRGSGREEVIQSLKQQLPANDDLITHYQRFVDSARQHLVDHNLLTMPEGDQLTLIDTPVFARNTYPFAGYMSSAPFETDRRGFFWVTPIDNSLPEETQLQQRRGHNKYEALVVALHEAYPGHHLQMYFASLVPSRVRKLFSTSSFAEGWALYCEEMMHETGFYPDRDTRLIQLKGVLWRACRVVIDVALHSGEMTFTDAVNTLVDTAKLEKINAIAEVKRYSKSPTQPMSYIIGKLEILKLRKEFERQKQSAFQLKNFHDSLLSCGTIPINLARQLVLEQK